MVLSVEPRSVLRSYTFLVASLMFGLPLLISYYAISNGLWASPYIVWGYLTLSLLVGLVLLLERKGAFPGVKLPTPGDLPRRMRRLGSVGPFAALVAATLAVVSFGLMRYFIGSSYPYPSSSAAFAGGVYAIALGAAVGIGFPCVVVGAFRTLRRALAERRLRIAAYAVGLAYFVTYEILVNEFLISGYNAAPGNFVQSPGGTYPFAYVFTSGPAPGNIVENAIYTPYVLVQLSPTFNFIFQPFELVLAVAMSVLVASTIVTTYYTLKQSERMGGACSASATLSGVGAFLGYTATCPSCLAPTLISVLFGGLSSVQLVYSNIWGAVLPPLVSITALVASMYMLGVASVPMGMAKSPAGVGSPEGSMPRA